KKVSLSARRGLICSYSLEVAYPLLFGKRLRGSGRRGWLALVKLLGSVHAGDLVHPVSRKANNLPGHPVTPSLRSPVGGDHGLHLLHGVSRMRPGGRSGLDVRGGLGREEAAE